MKSRNCLQSALIMIGLGLFCILVGPLHVMSLNLKYEEASGSKSDNIVTIKEVKDVSPNTYEDWKLNEMPKGDSRHAIADEFERHLRRVARAVANNTEPPTTSSNITTTKVEITKPTSATIVPQNKTETSDHKYYTSRFIQKSDYFQDLKKLHQAKNPFVIMRNLTNNKPNSIRYTIRNLKFKFQFYGHDVERAIVTSAGFIHIGPTFHSYVHDVHYVAPIMGDFFSTPGRSVIVYIHDDGARFTAQWDSVYEGGTNNSKPFTFQTTLFLNGTIVFAYKDIPYSIAKFVRKDFPPKIGLSDGFVVTEIYQVVVNGVVLRLPVRTIYRYHTVSLKKELVQSNSSFVLSPVPNCIQAKTCDACFDKVIAKNFKCKWCSKLQLCSDKFDWNRQKWIKMGCDKVAYDSQEKCNVVPKPTPTTKGGDNKMIRGGKSRRRSKGAAGAVIGILVAIIVISIAGVLFYGYRNPTSKLGMLMIQYRPSKLFHRSR